jgi:hypothetical protein
MIYRADYRDGQWQPGQLLLVNEIGINIARRGSRI